MCSAICRLMVSLGNVTVRPASYIKSASGWVPSRERMLLLIRASLAFIGLSPRISDTSRASTQWPPGLPDTKVRSEEHTSELQSLMRISYAVFCLKKKKKQKQKITNHP